MGLATTVFIQVHHSGTQTVPYLLNSMYFLKMFTCFTIKAGSPSDSGYTILEVYTEQCPVLLDKRSECQLARDLGCQGECLACTEDGTCSSSVQIEHIHVINPHLSCMASPEIMYGPALYSAPYNSFCEHIEG